MADLSKLIDLAGLSHAYNKLLTLINQKAGTSEATQSAAGLMSAADKKKLDRVDPANTPSFGDLANFLSRTGDTMTGDLSIQKNNPALMLKDNNSARSAEAEMLGSGIARFSNADSSGSLNYVDIRLNKQTAAAADLIKLFVMKSGIDTEYKLYGEHNKPTAADLGVASFATGTIPLGRMRGDVNGDGEITFEDSVLVNKHIVSEIELDEIQLWCADVNVSNSITGLDATQIQKYYGGVSSVLTSKPNMADYYSNWTYVKVDDLNGYFYTDVAVAGITAAHSATVIVKGSHSKNVFIGGECLAGAIRIKAKHLPIVESECQIYFTAGDGSALVVPESTYEPQAVDRVITLYSSVTNSTKKFNISVDDSGAITATEVTE